MTDSSHALAGRAAMLAAAALALAACGSTGAPATADDPAPTPTSEVTDHASPAPDATLTVSTTSKPGRHGVLFDEGAVPEIRLVGADGTTYRPVQDHTDTARFTSLVPGDYTLTAAQRPCDGNCGYLDPPTGRCSEAVRVTGDSAASVTFVVGTRCTISA